VNIKGKSWRLKEMKEAVQFTKKIGKEDHKGLNETIFSSKEVFFSHLLGQKLQNRLNLGYMSPTNKK